MKKYFFLTFLALSISSLSAGCLGLSKKSSRTQEAHMALVDQKILELDQALSGLNLNAQNLGKRVEELAQKTSAIDTNYSKLNTTLDELILIRFQTLNKYAILPSKIKTLKGGYSYETYRCCWPFEAGRDKGSNAIFRKSPAISTMASNLYYSYQTA